MWLRWRSGRNDTDGCHSRLGQRYYIGSNRGDVKPQTFKQVIDGSDPLQHSLFHSLCTTLLLWLLFFLLYVSLLIWIEVTSAWLGFDVKRCNVFGLESYAFSHSTEFNDNWLWFPSRNARLLHIGCVCVHDGIQTFQSLLLFPSCLLLSSTLPLFSWHLALPPLTQITDPPLGRSLLRQPGSPKESGRRVFFFPPKWRQN